jgi:hypothetical protein
MVTLFSDRIPLAMLFARKRPSSRLKSKQQSDLESVVEFSELPAPGRMEENPGGGETRKHRTHNAPSLARVRHVWYRDAVSHDPVYDSHYFVRTGEWVEPRCADPLCAWCRDRPKRHPEASLPTVPEWLEKRSRAPNKPRLKRPVRSPV